MSAAQSHAQLGEASPLLVPGSRSAGGSLQAVGATPSTSRLARRNASNRAPGKARGVANLAGHDRAFAMVPAVGPFEPCKALGVDLAGGRQSPSLTSGVYQSLNYRGRPAAAALHVVAPASRSPQ